MGEYISSFNSLVDAYTEHSEDIEWLKAKVADLEDMSRRNNIKIKGKTETIPATQLQQYAKNLFSAPVSSLSTMKLSTDKIHRLPKPAFIALELLRDVLKRVHFYQSKELIISSFRQASSLPEGRYIYSLTFPVTLSKDTGT